MKKAKRTTTRASWAALNARIAAARANPSEVRTTWCCPICSGPHSRADHEIIELQAVRQRALEEAERASESLETMREYQLRQFVARVDHRLGIDPGFERRRLIADLGRTSANRRRHS
jgi:hypothetical protein